MLGAGGGGGHLSSLPPESQELQDPAEGRGDLPPPHPAIKPDNGEMTAVTLAASLITINTRGAFLINARGTSGGNCSPYAPLLRGLSAEIAN